MRKEVFIVLFLLGCTLNPVGPSEDQTTDVVGTWRIYAETLYYDEGGGFAGKATQTLQLTAATWSFGDSKGTWSIEGITDADWARWGIEPYGPTKKIVLSGWNGAEADGPIEESSRIDFLWVIYRVKPPIVEREGVVWMKFGR